MTDMTLDTETPDQKKLKGWHVLLIMLGFFGVIFTVNGIFLYNAITSFPGEDVKKSYVQGLHYNDTLAARAAQAKLGWQAAAGIDGTDLIFQLSDQAGTPISGRTVIAELRRNASDEQDRTLALTARTGGEYVSDLGPMDKGEWTIRFSVMDADGSETLFGAEKTVIVK